MGDLAAGALMGRLNEAPEFAPIRTYRQYTSEIAWGMTDLAKGLTEAEGDFIMEIPARFSGIVNQILLGDSDGDIDNVNEYFGFLSWLVNDASATFAQLKPAASRILSATARRKAFVKKTLDKKFVDPDEADDLIKAYAPEGGLEAWQADSYDGKQTKFHMFFAKTVPERVIQRMEQEIADLAVEGELAVDIQEVQRFLGQMQKMMVVGGPKAQMILDSGIVEAVNNIRDREAEVWIEKITGPITRSWKAWTLFNLRRFARYMLNNFTTDIGAIMASGYGRRIFGNLNRARVMLAQAAEGRIDPLLRRAMEGNVLFAGPTAQHFEDLGGRPEDQFEQARSRVGRFFFGYIDWFRNIALWRENIFRFAAYLAMHDAIVERGQKPLETGKWGATPRHIIEGLQGEDLARRMSIDIMGDYWVSQSGRWLRKHMMPFWSFCVPMETEILTREGWRNYGEIGVGDEVLTWNVDKDQTEWQPIQRLHKFEYDAPLDVLTNSNVQFRWTPNHRVPVIINGTMERRDYGKREYQYPAKRGIVRSHELKSRHRIPLVAPHVDDGKAPALSVHAARLLGWIVTDGYFRWRGQSFESMVYQSPKKHANEIRATFKDEITSESIHPGTGVICFRMSATSATIKEILTVFRGKEDLPRIVTRLSEEGRKVMMDAMMKAEGSEGHPHPNYTLKAFVQTPGPVMEAFQILAYLNGIATNKRTAREDRLERMYLKKNRTFDPGKAKRTSEHYKGEVWCPVTENSTWVMRQNGSVMITGNTESNSVRHVNLIKNMYQYGGLAGMTRSVPLATSTALALGTRLVSVYALYMLWNHLFFEDEEEELTQFEKDRPHLILGRTPGGNIMKISGELGFSEFMDWFGFAEGYDTAREVVAGRAGVGDVLKEIGKAPMNKFVGSLTPIYKGAFELATGRSLLA